MRVHHGARVARSRLRGGTTPLRAHIVFCVIYLLLCFSFSCEMGREGG